MRRTASNFFFVIFFFVLLDPSLSVTYQSFSSIDTLELSKNDTILSGRNVFQLGFFTPTTDPPHSWYLGIWYQQDRKRTPLWVANRDNALSGSGILKFSDGDLVLFDRDKNANVWTANLTRRSGVVVAAELNDNGNFVVKDSEGSYLWQSFHFPTDTLLPEMKLSVDQKTRINNSLRSWLSPINPSTGRYSFYIEENDGLFSIFSTSSSSSRSSVWNGHHFGDMPAIFELADNDKEFVMTNHSRNYSKLSIGTEGFYEIHTWIPDSMVWTLSWSISDDACYGNQQCGDYGYCSSSQRVCNCIEGFDQESGSDRCMRRNTLNCSGDWFLKLKNMKLPEFSRGGISINSEYIVRECEENCRGDCTCTAFAIVENLKGRRRCVTWTGELKDMQNYTLGGQNLYVRLAAKDHDKETKKEGGDGLNILEIILIVGGVVVIAIAICIIAFYIWNWYTTNEPIQGPTETTTMINEITGGDRFLSMEFRDVVEATNHFSPSNELGRGGFGIVYKGVLTDGREVAVKRLSNRSSQGISEFKNEVSVILNILHINLVRLLGCCCEGTERILIYEFLENSSLDRYLFDESRSALLNWEKRFSIVKGIAQGLSYLHHFTNPQIIHRDLKPSNVLLDKDMIPKISDFGMASVMKSGTREAEMKNVAGTRGYMSEEYAMFHKMSEKSDVFSFGVTVLEIVTGKRNIDFCIKNPGDNLLDYTWRLYIEGKGLDLLDANCIDDSVDQEQLFRSIKIGLVCVQEDVEDRPNSDTISVMLGSSTTEIPEPKKPNYFYSRYSGDGASSSSAVTTQSKSTTLNKITLSVIGGR